MKPLQKNQDEMPSSIETSSLTVEDKFSKGRVHKFFAQSRYGFVKNSKGKDIYFNLDEVRFVGNKKKDDLKEGVNVGYDVGWTAKGIHINKMKIY